MTDRVGGRPVPHGWVRSPGRAPKGRASSAIEQGGPRRGRISVEVPYSIANVGPGFDRLALCLKSPRDRLSLEPGSGTELEIRGDASVPRHWGENAASVAYEALHTLCGEPVEGHLRLSKGARGGTGLGSSGASALAGALVAAARLGLSPAREAEAVRILRAASEGERVAAGVAHFDNVAASLFGGFVVVESEAPLIVHRIDPPERCRVVVALPAFAVSTADARALLPRAVPQEDVVRNLGHASSLVLGFCRGDWSMIGRNLVDRVSEPYRSTQVPGFDHARAGALAAGALGVALAGSGPAVFGLAPPWAAGRVAAAFRHSFEQARVPVKVFVTEWGPGARWSPH